MIGTQIGYGLVGCGGAAVDVAAAIARTDGARVAAVHDLRRDLAEDLGGPAGAAVHESLDDLLADPAVDAVYIGLPHDLLAPTAARVIAHGRPALVEKPMGLSMGEVEQLGAAAAAANLALGVLFELRETGPARLARRLVDEGAIGEVTAVRIRTLIDKPAGYWSHGLSGRSVSPWRAQAARAGGGVVLMNSIHQLDLVAFITGLDVVRVSGDVGTLMADPARVEVEDTAAGSLRFSNGAIGSLVAGAHSPGAESMETIELDGTLGSLRLPDPYGDGDLALFLRRPHGDHEAGRWLTLPAAASDVFGDALRAFTEAVRLRRPAPVGAADAARALSVVLRLYADAART